MTTSNGPSFGEAKQVLDFWFGELDEHGRADAAHAQRWWKKDEAFDAEIREGFGPLIDAVMAGAREAWLSEPRGALAYVIVLDQFSRNAFRGTKRSFAGDERALAATRRSLAAGFDRRLVHDERAFLYMPLMHAEDLEAQELCVSLFSALRDEAAPDQRADAEEQLSFAVQHRDIIARFGHFPHRNEILGRRSTPEEIAFLKTPGSSF